MYCFDDLSGKSDRGVSIEFPDSAISAYSVLPCSSGTSTTLIKWIVARKLLFG